VVDYLFRDERHPSDYERQVIDAVGEHGWFCVTIVSEGQRWSGLIEGFDCISRPVHPTWLTRDHFNTAQWYWGDPS